MEGINFDPTAFISSPYFWRAVILLVAMWGLKNMPAILDNVRYGCDKVAEVLSKRVGRQEQVEQVVIETLRQKLENGFLYDASFVVTLYESMVGDLRKRNTVLEDRLLSMTTLAVDKADESTQIVGLLNGTVSVFNTVAERLTSSIDQLNTTLGRMNGHG